MKTITTILIAATVLCLISCSSTTEDKGNQITVLLTEKMAAEEQWVYLVGDEGYQKWFIDSLLLEKNQREFTLSNINYSNPYNNAISKNIHLNFYFTKSRIGNQISLSTLDTVFNLNIAIYDNAVKSISGTGGRSNYTEFEQGRVQRLRQLAIKDTAKILIKQGVPRQRAYEIEDSLISADSELFEGECIADLDSESSELAWRGYNVLVTFLGYSVEQLAPYMERMKERFPDDISIQLYPEYPQYPLATKQTKIASDRIDEILGVTKPKPRPNVESYEIGDIVEELVIDGKDGKATSLGDSQEEYVLIDFWASWCAPCRRESYHLKDAATQYGDRLAIYAISLDKDKRRWLYAIEEDKIDSFTHVLLGDSSDESALIQAKFDIKGIPANFLLDKNRRIIAINLRGDELSQKLAELTTAK